MPRKRKYRKRLNSWYQRFDWTLEDNAKREILAVILILLGLILTLSIFGLAGNLGQALFSFVSNLFDLATFLLPAVLLAAGGKLWKGKEFNVKGTSILGTLGLFIFIPALFGAKGGLIGQSILQMEINLFGWAVAIIVNIALSFVCLIMATNLSWSKAKDWAYPDQEGGVKVNDNRVSVFELVKSKFSKKPQEAQSAGPGSAQVYTPSTYDKHWQFPPLDLLSVIPTRATSGNIHHNAEVIKKTLADFGIKVNMGEVNIGPTVTQYTLKPNEGIKLNQIVSRSNDLALALAAHSIRVEAPIPNKSAVGIEIPNKAPATVTLKEILEAEIFKKQKSPLSIALGRDVAGEPQATDLAKMPHLLIAGATGSGKSNFINSLILTLLFRNSPSDLRIILVDPKRVEFTLYNGIPHLLTPVVTEVKKTINTLRWAVSEMEKRFQLFSESHHRHIEEYNQAPSQGHMPYIVIIIDELADLMAQAANEVEAAIVRISQMARATGIHLVVATQRPSVDVITGLIKANVPTRIAFAVASQVDSRTILDISGAEKLLGNGDMLYQSAELGKPKRIQAPLISNKEIKAVTEFLRKEGEGSYDESIQNFRPTVGAGGIAAEGEADDEHYEEAKQIVIQYGKASASLLQRRLRIGYARAARILDILEQQGVIGPQEGSKPRDVLAKPGENSGQPGSLN